MFRPLARKNKQEPKRGSHEKDQIQAAAARRKNELERLEEQGEIAFKLYKGISDSDEVTHEELMEFCGGDPVPLKDLPEGRITLEDWMRFLRSSQSCKMLDRITTHFASIPLD